MPRFSADRPVLPLGRLATTDSDRPEAVTGHPTRIAVIRARRYAIGLYARSVASTRKSLGCCVSCLVILWFA